MDREGLLLRARLLHLRGLCTLRTESNQPVSSVSSEQWDPAQPPQSDLSHTLLRKGRDSGPGSGTRVEGRPGQRSSAPVPGPAQALVLGGPGPGSPGGQTVGVRAMEVLSPAHLAFQACGRPEGLQLRTPAVLPPAPSRHLTSGPAFREWGRTGGEEPRPPGKAAWHLTAGGGPSRAAGAGAGAATTRGLQGLCPCSLGGGRLGPGWQVAGSPGPQKVAEMEGSWGR